MRVKGNPRLCRGILILLVSLVGAYTANAQNIRRVDAYCADKLAPADLSECVNWDIYVHYAQELDTADANTITDPKHYFILDTAGMPGQRDIAIDEQQPPAVESPFV